MNLKSFKVVKLYTKSHCNNSIQFIIYGTNAHPTLDIPSQMNAMKLFSKAIKFGLMPSRTTFKVTYAQGRVFLKIKPM